jgi:hypothetical protein
MNRPTVFVAGTDMSGRTLWTWQWDDGSAPRYDVIEAQNVVRARAALVNALPDPIRGVDEPGRNSEVSKLVGKLDPSAARERRFDSYAVVRCLTGAMADVDAEHALSKTLTEAFLPDRLAEELKQRCTLGKLGLFRVLSPPSAYAVPWELLVIGDARLIDLADVVHVAPPLGRDGTDHRPRQWTNSPPLRVVDPADRHPVLAPFTADKIKHAQMYGWGTSEIRQRYTPQRLSADLTDAACSRLLWVGHVSSTDGTPGSVALEMSRPSDQQDQPTRLSAAMLFTDVGDTRAADSGRAWPAPSRVALIACRSGSDMSHVEPFGLVVAFLQAGAELVTATKWTLPTDLAIAGVMALGGRRRFTPGAGPFNAAAHAVDRIQCDADPIRALGDWQRGRLKDWRSTGDLSDSPIIWAALANHHAPYRTVEDA